MSLSYSEPEEVLPPRVVVPEAQYHSEPTAAAYDADELSRDASGLPRLLSRMEARVAAFESEPRTWTAAQVFAVVTDPAAWLVLQMPVLKPAQAALARLEEVLGQHGWVHDTSSSGHPGSLRLSIVSLRERLNVLQAAVAAAVAAAGKRRGAP